MWRRAAAGAAVPLLGALAPQGRRQEGGRRWRGRAVGTPCHCEEGPGGRSPAATEALLPRTVDVVIVGGGIAGASTALQLARASKRVALLERESCGAGATGLSCATICAWGQGDGSDAKAALALATLEELRALEAEGRDCGLVECACLLLARTQEELRWAREEAERKASRGYAAELLDPAAAERVEPALRGAPITGALLSRTGAYADPGATMQALAEAAQAAGSRVCEGCEVLSARPGGPERWLVHTSGGAIACQHVVICAGAWAGEVGRRFGLELPVVKVKAQMAAIEPDAQGAPLTSVIYSAGSHAFWDAQQTLEAAAGVPNAVTHDSRGARLCHHVYGRPAPGGCVWFGGDRLPLPRGGDDFQVDEAAAEENLAHVDALLPALGLAGGSRQAWAGIVGPTLHGGSLVGELLFCPGLWLCTGFGGSGFMQGVGAGAAVASWIASSGRDASGEDAFRAVKVQADPTPWVRPASADL